jgi:hypothetical protein
MEFQRGDAPLLGETVDDEVPSFEQRVRLIGMQIRHYAHIAPPTDGLTALAAAIEG